MSNPKGFGDSAVLDLGEIEGTTHTFSNMPDSALDQDDDLGGGDTDELLGGSGQNPSGLKSYSFWSMQFYQQFFDVDTDDVMKRVLWSVLPRPGGSTANFFKSKIRVKPDLYGPFWICVTLIFSMAIAGNIASYLQTDTVFKWHYDFHKVSIVSSAVFGYAWLTPALLFFAMWWLGSKATTEGGATGGAGGITFLELLCIYGYSLAIFIPLSVLWLIQVSAVQWILLLIGFGLSGGVLAMSLWPDLTKKSPKFGTILVLVILGLHLLLGCGFMLGFFHASSSVVKVDQPVIGKNETSIVPPKDSLPSSKSESKEKREEKEVDHQTDAKVIQPDVNNKPEVENKSEVNNKSTDPKNDKAPEIVSPAGTEKEEKTPGNESTTKTEEKAVNTGGE